MIHLPVHASWLNQIEIYFSVVQRKLVTPDDFANLAVFAEQLTAFETRYNTAARPFDWRFNRDDLTQLLQRLRLGPPRLWPVIPEGAGPVNPLFLFLIFLLAVLRLLLDAPG